MPLSCLTWTRAGRPSARARAATRSRKPSVQTLTAEPAPSTTSTSASVSAPSVSRSTRRCEAAGRSAASPGRRHRERARRRRPAPPRRSAIGPVAVAVGLHHRAEPRLAQLGPQPFAVGAHGAEVDPGDRPLHGSRVEVVDDGGERVGPRDHARQPPVLVDHRQMVVMVIGDLLRHAVGRLVGVDDDRVGGHQLRDFRRERLFEPLLEALHRADEDDPAHDVRGSAAGAGRTPRRRGSGRTR